MECLAWKKGLLRGASQLAGDELPAAPTLGPHVEAREARGAGGAVVLAQVERPAGGDIGDIAIAADPGIGDVHRGEALAWRQGPVDLRSLG
ncbi:hypothetical protein QU38_02600, partial [Staphylococcus aureus]